MDEMDESALFEAKLLTEEEPTYVLYQVIYREIRRDYRVTEAVHQMHGGYTSTRANRVQFEPKRRVSRTRLGKITEWRYVPRDSALDYWRITTRAEREAQRIRAANRG